MTEIVGIQFKNASRVYYFSPLTYKFKLGEYAIVETVRGLELGKVIIANRMVEDNELPRRQLKIQERARIRSKGEILRKPSGRSAMHSSNPNTPRTI